MVIDFAVAIAVEHKRHTLGTARVQVIECGGPDELNAVELKALLMKLLKLSYVFFSMFLAACSAQRTTPASDDLVEVSNPFFTASPNAPATIWVPRSSVESGLPRGTDLVSKGVSKLSDTLGSSQQTAKASATPAQPSTEATANVQSSVAASSTRLKKRIVVFDLKNEGLLAPVSRSLERSDAGPLLDHHQQSFESEMTSLNTAEWNNLSVRMRQKFNAPVSIFVWAPEHIVPGKELLGSIYDGYTGAMVRTVTVQIHDFTPGDPASQSAAISASADELAGKLKAVVELLPWYGKIVAVDNGKIYINAGKESGLALGQALKVYRGGRVVAGIGFIPGDQVATVEIRGLVGFDGASGEVVKGSGDVKVDDLVAVE